VPGALLGGWLGEHIDLRASLAFAGLASAALAVGAWRLPLIREVRSLPRRVSVSGTQAIEDATT